MKNMKISAKLLLGFSIVALIAALIGGVGIIGIKTVDNSYTQAYIDNSKPIPDMAKVLEYSQRLRVQMRNFVIYTGNAEKLSSVNSDVSARISEFEDHLAAYDASIVNAEARKLYDDAKDKYYNGYKPLLLEVQQKSNAGAPMSELIVLMDSGTDISNKMVEDFEKCMDIKVAAAEANSDANTVLGNLMLTIMIIILVLGIIIAMILAVYISRIVSKPVNFMKDVLSQMGMKGVVNFSDEEYRQAEVYATKDEVGESIKMLIATGRRLETVGHALETVAGGDLTQDLKLLSDNDTMGISLQKMVENLNKMFGEINSSSNQVSTGSVQIADGAQLLAQGATEQSATVEELSASIAEIAAQTKANAGTANETSELAENIKVSAEQGSRQMGQMMQAVAEINESSKSIGKVIKIIDDIAFQTNILALNAAVEAARAGQHGKGFAVVADEVRSLAAKSAEAAKNTNELIESSIQKAEQGASISAETSESLQQIVGGILKTSELVANIAKSSNEQSIAINQIGEAIDQVSQVVQQNSATAEESAAASEEMSGQATLLQQLISQFKLKESVSGYSGGFSTPTASPRVSPMSSSGTGFALDTSSKY